MILHPEGLKSSYSNTVIEQLFSKLPNKPERVLLLDSVYKTNYSTTDTGHHTSVDGEAYPLKYYKSTHTAGDAVLSAFLNKHQPAGVLNFLGGFTAALLIFAEINGVSAACINSIIDAHYISAETLQAFAPIVNDVLQIPDANLDQISRYPAFKAVLKEANTRGNNIFN